jgi:putative ABC transport system permease protein
MILTFTEIKEGIRMAMGAISANKFRAGLTILGVMIGVSSVIGMAALVDGLHGAMNRQIDQLGSNIIMVSRMPPNVDHDELTEDLRNRPPITEGEARAIQENAQYVDGVSPQNYYFQPGGNIAKYKNRKFNRPSLFGTWPDYVKVRDRQLQSGRFLSPIDEQYRLMVCVVGSSVAQTLFEGEPPVGKEIRVNGYKFEVVGVLEEVKMMFGNQGENNAVIIPLSTFGKLYPWEEALGLSVRANSFENVNVALDEITGILRAYRKVPFNEPNNFELSTQEQFKDFIGNVTKYIYIAMIVITSVGLMVGGIGVMNIMLVSVTERTREIGVRKAIGAKRINIVLQFLTEAMALSGTGGVIGVIIGIAAGLAINALIGFPVSLPIFWVVVGFIVSVSVGLVSGVYPAFKAARLDPIEALRYE